MEEKEKQEGQKTVVAFVAGLLIGGLLVWVFSASPDAAEAPTDGADMPSTEEPADGDMHDGEEGEHMHEDGEEHHDDEKDMSSDDVPPAVTVSENASINIDDQPAGVMVQLGELGFPTEVGWVVVHENQEGGLGNALGAARFDLNTGLVTSQVRLLRGTEAGKSYTVVLYSENGDKLFDLASDRPLTRPDGSPLQASFTAL